MNGCVRAVLIIVALTAADVAVAHAPMGEGVSGGLLHPYLVPAHAMSLVALGLFIGRRREQGIPLLAFAAALIGGLVALTFAIAETPAAEILLGNTGLLGVLLAADWNPPKPFGWMIAAVTGGRSPAGRGGLRRAEFRGRVEDVAGVVGRHEVAVGDPDRGRVRAGHHVHPVGVPADRPDGRPEEVGRPAQRPQHRPQDRRRHDMRSRMANALQLAHPLALIERLAFNLLFGHFHIEQIV